MSIHLSFRPGTSVDVDACLALNHQCESDRVWQMTLNATDPTQQVQIGFRVEKLPRTISLIHIPDRRRLHDDPDLGRLFVVARPYIAVQPHIPIDPESPDAPLTLPPPPPRQPIIGYVVAHYDEMRGLAWLDDVCVSEVHRRQKIAAQLVDGVRLWAREQGATRLLTAIPTKHAPMIALCQGIGMIFCGYNDQFFPNHDIAILFGLRLSRARRVE
jgi:GNAT superfamily N-acetyltransferase